MGTRFPLRGVSGFWTNLPSKDNLRFNMGFCLWGDMGNEDVENTPCTTR
jgi:hypothetical protein